MVLPYYLVLGVEHCGLRGAWCVRRPWGPEWELIDSYSRLLPLFRPTRTSFTVLECPLGGGCKNRDDNKEPRESRSWHVGKTGQAWKLKSRSSYILTIVEVSRCGWVMNELRDRGHVIGNGFRPEIDLSIQDCLS